jgi:hypothetical protein
VLNGYISVESASRDYGMVIADHHEFRHAFDS